MIKTARVLCLALFLSNYCNAQMTWEKLFVRSNTDVFRSVQEVPSGGYIAAGYTSHWSNNDTDAYVVRLTTLGDTMWTRTFNGGRKDLLYKVINTADGGFAMCGYKTTLTDPGDAYYMKIDANGNQLWQFTYGGTGNERAQDIIQTADGGYAICGYTSSGTGAQGFNSFLLKLDANGGQTWSMKYGGNGFDDANSVKEVLPSGDFIMVGQSTSAGGLGLGDIWLVRTNSTGAMSWSQRIGTALNDNAEYIQLSAAGGFIICGSTEGLGMGGDDGYLVKTDDLGVVQWFKTYGGSSPDDFHRVENTSDGGYILTGTTQSNVSIISDIWFFKTDANGDSTWAYVFGGANHDHGYSGCQTSDGGYILCGYTASFGFNYEDALVIKVDSNGLLYNHLVYTTVTALVSPVNGSCGSTNAVVTITVRNFGDTAVSTFPDTVIITGAINQTLGQTFTGTLVPSDFANHTFTTTINTSAGGVFNFHCFTSTNNDVCPAMNSCDSTITINALPTPPVAVGDTSCGPGSVTLTATSLYNIDWFSSSSGGVSLGSGPSYTASISNTTTFYVQASNGCGTSSRTAVTAYVFPVTPPPTVFSAQRCGPGNVTLLASSGSPISWWDSATGGTMLQGNINAYVVYVTTTTTFYVEAGTGGFCPSNRVPVTATVNLLPDAGFTPSAPAVCLGDAFIFTNTTTGAVGYSWDFGDGSGTSTQTNPSYTYALTNNYSVRLIAVSAQSCKDTVFVNVSVNTAPQVGFSADFTSGCLPLTVNFTNTTINAVDYLWSFGDGTATSILENPAYTYNAPGTYTVSLNATVGSCADADTFFNYIVVIPSPVADFTAVNACLGNVIDFTNASSGATNYNWDFGDGTGNSTLVNPSYSYLTSNTFTVTLIASDGICNDTITQDITIYAPPVFDFGPDISTNSVTYLLDAGSGFSNYLWNNGSTSQSITTDTNGIYCVTVTDLNNCSDTDCVNVTLDAAGIENNDRESHFIIYPNPAQNAFTIFISKADARTTCELKIYDAVGRVTFSSRLNNEMVKVTIANWPRGIYSVEINSEKNVLRKKLILY